MSSEKEKSVEKPKVQISMIDLQSQILQFTLDIQKFEAKDYIGHCKVCIKEVDREEMIYKRGHLFHQSCYDKQGGEFLLEDASVNEGKRAKVDLVYLKNLEVRSANQRSVNRSSAKPKKKKSSVKRKKTQAKRKVKRKSTKRKPTKKRKVTRKTKTKKRKITRKKSSTKRRKSTKKRKVTRKRVKRKASRKRRR